MSVSIRRKQSQRRVNSSSGGSGTTPNRYRSAAMAFLRPKKDSTMPNLSIYSMDVDPNQKRDEPFLSPLFHYASNSNLPLSPLLRPPTSTIPLGVRSRAASLGSTLGANGLNNRADIQPMSSFRYESCSQFVSALQPTPTRKVSPSISPKRERVHLAPSYLQTASRMTSISSSSSGSGNDDHIIHSRRNLSPLLDVPFEGSLSKHQTGGTSTFSADSGLLSASSEVLPGIPRVKSVRSKDQRKKDKAVQRGEQNQDLTAENQIIYSGEEGVRMSAGEEGVASIDGIKSESKLLQPTGSTAASAETLLSLIQQNRLSEQSGSSQSQEGNVQIPVQSQSGHQVDGQSQGSSISSLESFSLHTLSHALSPSSIIKGPSRQDDIPTHPIAKQQQVSSPQYDSHTHPNANSHNTCIDLQAKQCDYKTDLEEGDVEVLEEEPFILEQTNLKAVRRRLVEEVETLGGKISRNSRSKSVSKRARRQSSSRTEDLPPTSWTYVSENDAKRREEALEAREKDLTVEALSKAEMSHVRVEIWTESRKGRWTVRGPVRDDGSPVEELPKITDLWAIPIDSKGIVRRKKLKSNIELSSTRTVVECSDCIAARRVGVIGHCRTCESTGRVEMVFSIQCIIRLAQFLPLKLPAVHLLGSKQPHIKYIDDADLDQTTDILHDRAVDGLQSAAGRVIEAHYKQHGSRLLMGRATISRRGLLTVCATSSRNKSIRVFDVEDGQDGKITEVVNQIKEQIRTPECRSGNVILPPTSSDTCTSNSIYLSKPSSYSPNQSNSTLAHPSPSAPSTNSHSRIGLRPMRSMRSIFTSR